MWLLLLFEAAPAPSVAQILGEVEMLHKSIFKKNFIIIIIVIYSLKCMLSTQPVPVLRNMFLPMYKVFHLASWKLEELRYIIVHTVSNSDRNNCY